jgi:hypothetical protein
VYSWNCSTSGGPFQPFRPSPQQIQVCIIVASRSGVSFLFPEQGSRLPPFVGPASTRVGSFLSSCPKGQVPSVALLLQSYTILYDSSHKNLLNLILSLVCMLLPHLWISPSLHQDTFTGRDNSTLSLGNSLTEVVALCKADRLSL